MNTEVLGLPDLRDKLQEGSPVLRVLYDGIDCHLSNLFPEPYIAVREMPIEALVFVTWLYCAQQLPPHFIGSSSFSACTWHT